MYDAGVPTIGIDSRDDERLSEFRNVPDPELLARRGIFVAEGRLVVARLLRSRLETRAVLATETALAAIHALIAHATFPVYVVSQDLMNGVAGFNFHRGCLAIGVRPSPRDWRGVVEAARLSARSTDQDPAYASATQDAAHGSPAQDPATGLAARLLAHGSTTSGSAHRSTLVALERVGNADNVGSIFRNAAAFGAGGVLLQADCADPLYRKAIRTSMGASLTMAYATAPWPDVLCELVARGWATVAMTPAADAPLLRDVAATLAGQPVVIVLGHEGDGLTTGALAACSHHGRIAMANGVDSVNVATAAGIALYEMGSGVIDSTARLC
jgi:tRNA G18 (ribose-2'-O)-methylase SpoU